MIILAEENWGPDVVMPDFTGFTTDPVKEKNHERNGGYGGGGKGGDEGFQDMDIAEVQELTAEELTEDNLLEMSVSKPVPDSEAEETEEAVPESRRMLDNLAEAS